MSDVCSSCPHAVADHEATGCITCQCGAVYAPADPEVTVPVTPEPEPTPEPESSTVVPETEDETGTVVPESEFPDPEPNEGE